VYRWAARFPAEPSAFDGAAVPRLSFPARDHQLRRLAMVRRAPSQTWRTFLRNHAHHMWAADLLSVPTLTFKTLHVLVFIVHGRRELV
jgi:hypothetical protein